VKAAISALTFSLFVSFAATGAPPNSLAPLAAALALAGAWTAL